ncbi:MAG: Swt1 family HEPN domain-containing protein [Planctomycetota bacterium]|nr:Swt1 family HEPN domain-containing protein [Planctomycetota bacterium]
MNDLIKMATAELERFLSTSLPKLSTEWWQKRVIDRLSFQQQRLVQERRYAGLEDLDFAALLRVLDQNWFELSDALSLPREARNWVKELQTVRNKWAHISSRDVPSSEIYRDADTLGRVLEMIGASAEALTSVEEVKSEAVQQLAAQALPKPIESPPVPFVSSAPEHAMRKESQIEQAARTRQTALFAVGDLVTLRSNPSVVMPVIEVLDAVAGERCYRAFHNNAKATYFESQLQAMAAPADNQTQLTAEELHASLTSLQLRAPSCANLYSLRSGRVKFVPYQYRPVLKLIRSDRPRLLIADEVGVGKTIEAGLIIKELQARMDLSSVLIICPKALVAERKWFVEMKRFEEQFTALDGALLRHCLQETHLDGEWPDQYSKAILPFSLFDKDLIFGPDEPNKKHQGLLNLDPPPKFDLVIVDEAHHIRNTETYLHHGVRYFCDNADAVLFLSATPVQLGQTDLYTLLNVLRPDLIIDAASFAQMAAPNRFINAAIRHCRQGQEGWASEARSSLDDAAQTEWGRLFIRETPAFQQTYDQLQQDSQSDADRVAVTRSIEELYTFSNLINRTRRRDIGEFTVRKPETLTVEFTDGQRDFLVNYDLPWNPMRIEQRIGRIDRYGQQSPTVVIVNLITPGTVDAEIYDRCLLRIGVFQHAIGGNEEILGEITQELKRIEENFELTEAERHARFKQLADNGIRQLNEEQELESKQAELFGLNIPNQKWLKDIESAQNYWLSPSALQQCVISYLASRLDQEQDYLLGDKPVKTLRLNKDARPKLLDDFKQLPRTKDPVAREWKKWLKGTTPTVSVTFDQEAAAENPKTLHLSVTHPLLRQAASHLKLDTTAYTTLEIQTSDISPGEYLFGIYHWSKQGVKPDKELVAVADDAAIEERLFSLLQSATTCSNPPPMSPAQFKPLDAQHHRKWSAARANHEADNRQLVEYRIHSLTVSHQARCKAIEDQLNRATNDKIRLMKQSELERANADFARRIESLNQATRSGDIHATPVLFGTLIIELHFRGSCGEGNQILEEPPQFAVVGAVRQSGEELFSQHFSGNTTTPVCVRGTTVCVVPRAITAVTQFRFIDVPTT